MCASNILCDLCERLIPPTIKLIADVQNQYMVHFIAPASHEPCSGFKTGSTGCMRALPFAKLFYQALNVAAFGTREASLSAPLNSVRNSAS